MKRRLLLLGVTAIIITMVVAVASQQQNNPPLLLLERALKAEDKTPPVAILIEMGNKDEKPADWSGQATVQGAKVIHREGYRFRKGDKLVDPNGWQAKSNWSIRAPKNNPVINRMEGVTTVGVVLHLSDVGEDASLTIQTKENQKPGKVSLKKVLAGETVKLWDGAVYVRRISMAMPVATGPTEDDQPAAAYGPDGNLWIAYTSYKLRDPKRSIESPQYKKEPENFKQLYHPDFAEQLWVRPYRSGKWGQPIPITDAKQDIARCAVAVTNDNQVWIIYSANRDGNFDIYARSLSGVGGEGAPALGKEVRLTENPDSDLSPVACVDSAGIIRVAYQAWNNDGKARIGLAKFTQNKWTNSVPPPIEFQNEDGNYWHPAIAAGPNGQFAISYDVYRDGNYDVDVVISDGTSMGISRAAWGEPFQARPSITYDVKGRLWLAHEVGPEKWGKDYGALDSEDGNPLYNGRTVQVLCLEVKPDRRLNILSPVAKLPGLEITTPKLPFEAIKTNKFERFPRYAYPQIGIDGKGGIWLTYRRNFGSRYSSHPGAIWKTYARRLNGDNWSDEILVAHSDGLLDHRPVLLPHVSGGLAIVHNTDGRETTPDTINNQIYLSLVNHPGTAKPPDFIPVLEKATKPPQWVLAEWENVKRIKNQRIKSGDKAYQLLRGEYHRHTEISWDGAPDGSLEDMFRYAIDAAAFDWIGNGDHDNGAGREYPWYLTQKYTAAYTTAKHFTPMYTYERSVSYPHGHRNVMFAKRGVMTLPRLAAAEGEKAVAGISPDDTKMLYKYLREMDGICAVHTSATGMGTDWRDNDPKVEPIVEIYQGDRMSYEHFGAPRAGYDPQGGMLPANVGGWKPLGFLDNALKNKGYKLAFQASSDHWSTHISYFIVLAETHDRDGILAAVKKRHCYGATDNIIVDLRSGEHIQGDEFTTNEAPSLQFTVIGTDKIAKIDVMKNSEAVATLKPNAKDYKGKWTDPAPDGKTHYYYIRVLQSDGEVAWASPMWITQKK